MKFICPKCGREDEVIGDEKPLCLVCRTALVKAAPGYANLMMNPNFAIQRFETVVRKYGSKQSLSGRFKQEREAWITSVWALGLREISGRQYWIEIETKDLTPDCKVHQIDQSSSYNRILTHNVEVVEWEPHRDEVIDVIRQKCEKAYPKYFTLLVFARNSRHVDFDQLLQQVRALSVPFSEIWILGRLSSSSAKYCMLLLYPTTKLLEFDLFEVFRKNNTKVDLMQRRKRGKSTKMESLGITYLPIP